MMSSQLFSKNCFGFCATCGYEHQLPSSELADEYALELIARLDREKRIDFDATCADSRFSTDYLFGEARGQMFGVLVCESPSGEKVILKAFSCQYNSVWQVSGWVPPILDLSVYGEIVPAADKEIKAFSRQMENLQKGTTDWQSLALKRKEISQKLMKEIHELYNFQNFAGQKTGIFTAFVEPKGIPTGTGDCCAPKLLGFAAQQGLKPLSLSEFYYGRETKSGSRHHKNFYSCCKEKCQPILGFMLCGVDKI